MICLRCLLDNQVQNRLIYSSATLSFLRNVSFLPSNTFWPNTDTLSIFAPCWNPTHSSKDSLKPSLSARNCNNEGSSAPRSRSGTQGPSIQWPLQYWRPSGILLATPHLLGIHARMGCEEGRAGRLLDMTCHLASHPTYENIDTWP